MSASLAVTVLSRGLRRTHHRPLCVQATVQTPDGGTAQLNTSTLPPPNTARCAYEKPDASTQQVRPLNPDTSHMECSCWWSRDSGDDGNSIWSYVDC